MPDRLQSLLQTAAIILALAIGFTFFGIYNNGTAPWIRFLMWLVTIGTGVLASGFIIPFVFGTRFEPWPLAVRVLAGSILIAIPVTLSLAVFDLTFNGRLSPAFIPIQYAYVFAITLVLVMGGYVLSLARQTPAGSTELTQPDAASGFLARLPLKFRQADLHAISSEDHYLRVHTSLGEELILMRLADAVRELDGAGGLQVHRSWWVAPPAVCDVKRAGGKITLVLPSGKEVPVSRTYAAAARDAGLI